MSGSPFRSPDSLSQWLSFRASGHLLAEFQNYAAHQRERSQTRKRGGGCEVISIDAISALEDRMRDEPVSEETPERAYDRKWAMSLLERAFASVRARYEGSGKGTLFEELRGALWGGRGGVNYAEVSVRLATTEGALKVAVHRLRRSFSDELRAEVARTVVDPAEIDDEVRYLLAAFEL